MYRLRSNPPGLKSHQAAIIQHGDGSIFGGYVTYQASVPGSGVPFMALSITVQRGFPRPYPVWYEHPVEENAPSVTPEKVDYVPGGAGILIRTRAGFDLHWIQHEGLYSLSAEHVPGLDPKIVSSLLERVD